VDGQYTLELTALSFQFQPENAEDMLRWNPPGNKALDFLDDSTFPSIIAYRLMKCDAGTGNSLRVAQKPQADGSITLSYTRTRPKSCCVPTVASWNVTAVSLLNALNDTKTASSELWVLADAGVTVSCDWFAASIARCFLFGNVAGQQALGANEVCLMMRKLITNFENVYHIFRKFTSIYW
jgi:hypothetical protein